MRTIIVGVDDSETAGRAAVTAAELARSTGARLHVVCAYAKESVTEVGDGSDHWHLTASGVAAGTAERVAAQLSSIASDIVGTAVEGKPADALVEAATETGADLIVVGNRRVQGPGRLLGSIATAVAHQAPCDVYIAHTR
ncbi:Universal stress protein [Nocardioides dokdonensis FR1436]|uniref:Universal stress protein n=1 Tax=Nocardioides dokdonensis FR1436 TaxID=1300347 RepID=A0A1A9GH96_9ACTN|nr:universal stress protein [Nocardioides dokdonensis]ANH37012.1 Universal stress protein [Nocardioides dokdonensis FR1436]